MSGHASEERRKRKKERRKEKKVAKERKEEEEEEEEQKAVVATDQADAAANGVTEKKKKKKEKKRSKKSKSGDDRSKESKQVDEEKADEDQDDSDEDTPVTFASLGVTETICEACAAMGFKTATQIQKEAIPVALQGRDVIGLAETGSGKTAAFSIPMLQALLEAPQPLFACILAPTRELCFQIAEQVEALGSVINVKCATIVGGIDITQQAIALARKPHVIIATPGRLIDHLENTKGFSLRALKYLVMDEADRLLNMDFEEEINKLLQVIPKERTTLLFSATMTSKVAKLQRASLVDPVKVSVSSKYQTVKQLRQSYLFLPAKAKDVHLVAILNQYAGNSAIVFTSTCKTTQRVTLMLRNLGFQAVPLHGQMTQPKRLGSLAKFKSGQRNILLATDVASRGLDIPSVDLVINYDIPTHSKDYIHRVGRTARAGRAGVAVSMVSQYEVELYQRIEQMIGKKLDKFPLDKEEVMLLMERVGEAQRYAAVEMREQNESKGRGGRRGLDDDEDGGNGYSGKKGKGRKRQRVA